MDKIYERLDMETDFEYKRRLCIEKIRNKADLEWLEIIEALDIDVSPDHLRKTAYGIVEYDDYINGFTGVATRILSISDLHIPFQLPITTFCDYVGNVDILQINGDVLDCQSLSKFPKQYRISPMDEMVETRKYLIDLIEYIKPKETFVNFGNHDIRLGAYLAKHLDTDINALLPNTSLESIIDEGFYYHDKRNGSKTYYEPLKNVLQSKITYINDWKVKIGKTWFVHPLAYRQGNLATCEKAMDYLHRTEKESFDTIVMAHTHKVGETKKGFIMLYEQGTCSDVDKLHYMDGRLSDPQKQGFMYICQNKDGSLIKDKTKVIVLN